MRRRIQLGAGPCLGAITGSRNATHITARITRRTMLKAPPLEAVNGEGRA
jgi:hypothetical protein